MRTPDELSYEELLGLVTNTLLALEQDANQQHRFVQDFSRNWGVSTPQKISDLFWELELTSYLPVMFPS